MSSRSNALADRIEDGARALAAFADGLTDAQWRATVPPDSRSVAVIVHHVASVYPIEVELARTIATGKPISGVTWAGIAEMNAKHAHTNAEADKAETLALLRRNAHAAAEAVRAFTDLELDRAGQVSLNADAPLTAQYVLEDHAVRHSFHHLAKIRAALQC